MQQRWAMWALTAALGLCGAGCTGGGRVEVVPLNYRSIDPPPALTAHLDFDRCYWWTDESGQIWIAMESVRRPALGSLGDFRFQMSLVLEKLPTGRARHYVVAKRELRAVARFALTEGRYVSSAGIAALYREPNHRLRGSFRLLTRFQASRLLGGWGRPSSHVLQGTFEAVYDPRRGCPIAAATESQGWQREPPDAESGRAEEGRAGPGVSESGAPGR